MPTEPESFTAALDKLGRRTPTGSKFSSAEWGNVPTAIRERAFFTASTESALFASRAQDMLLDFIKGSVETLATGETRIKVGGRTEFIRAMQAFIKKEGIPRKGRQGTIVDIGSSVRLSLIFDVNVRAAHFFGRWKAETSPASLLLFPAMRFIRGNDVKIPRPLHEANRGVVRLKSDLPFWLAMNSRRIGGFEVPWGPWGFNSGMDTEEVGRAEAERLGLLRPGQPVESPDVGFSDHLSASVRALGPDLRKQLEAALGPAARIEGDEVIQAKPGSSPSEGSKTAMKSYPKAAKPKRTSGFPRFDELRRTRPGSVDAVRPMIHPDTGVTYTSKRGEAKALQTELAAHDAYAVAGVPVMPARILPRAGDSPVLVVEDAPGERMSRWMSRVRPERYAAAIAAIAAGFAADALFGNREVNSYSVVVDDDDRPVRTGLDGVFDQWPGGTPKLNEWGPDVAELSLLRDPMQNPAGALFYGRLTDAEIATQIRALHDRRADILATVPAEIAIVLDRRFGSLRDWLAVHP